MKLGPLYHWSPADRYASIKKDGLTVGHDATVSTHGEPQLCFGPDPASAWSLSGAMDWVAQIDEWDLWQISLRDTDAVHVRAVWGDEITEIRVDGPIEPSRCWHVGRRTA